ncbi:MAG: 50S ribosomal protein L13 [Candidatus Nanohaloarchaeota archaeon QJJ-9]|nr:50S ribosomal protein L13 [Candidatus Nanohaloarchaeota archaeon QJJ-9]
MIVDAENHVLGRLATSLVEELKDGKEIDVINGEKAIVKGNPDDIIEKYQGKHDRGTRHFGPYFPKDPEKIVKRTVRGMLPDNKEGEKMLKKLKVHKDNPSNEEGEVFEDAREETLKGSNYMTIEQISKNLS